MISFINLYSDSSAPSAPSAVPAPAPVPVPASETPAPADKPAKSKAELKAERRARQEAERASKQGKKGDVGQQATAGKPKAPPSELQPGTVVVVKSPFSQTEMTHYTVQCRVTHTLYVVFSVVKRLPEHIQVDNPDVLKKLAKKLERQQVGFYSIYCMSFLYIL